MERDRIPKDQRVCRQHNWLWVERQKNGAIGKRKSKATFWRHQLSQRGWNGVRKVIRGGSRCQLNSRTLSVSVLFRGFYREAGTGTWDPEIFGHMGHSGAGFHCCLSPLSYLIVVTFMCILKHTGILGDFWSSLFNDKFLTSPNFCSRV